MSKTQIVSWHGVIHVFRVFGLDYLLSFRTGREKGEGGRKENRRLVCVSPCNLPSLAYSSTIPRGACILRRRWPSAARFCMLVHDTIQFILYTIVFLEREKTRTVHCNADSNWIWHATANRTQLQQYVCCVDCSSTSNAAIPVPEIKRYTHNNNIHSHTVFPPPPSPSFVRSHLSPQGTHTYKGGWHDERDGVKFDRWWRPVSIYEKEAGKRSAGGRGAAGTEG